jgi:glycine cleavage system H protein
MSTTPPPTDRRYSETHEWHKQDGETITIGITRFAVDELSDVTFVDLPPIGKKVVPGKSWGEIESVKATSELYCAVAGDVCAVNEQLKDDPSLVNADPYGAGWLIKIKAPGADLSGLISGADYGAQHGG